MITLYFYLNLVQSSSAFFHTAKYHHIRYVKRPFRYRELFHNYYRKHKVMHKTTNSYNCNIYVAEKKIEIQTSRGEERGVQTEVHSFGARHKCKPLHSFITAKILALVAPLFDKWLV